VNVRALSSRLTRQSRSNFYYAFLALPRRRRAALYAVYAFCRTVDDIADTPPTTGVGATTVAEREARRHQLRHWRDDVARCFEPGATPVHPIARELATAVRAYPIPREALLAIIDGVEMDLDGRTYETADDLYPYCYRVASAVGLCSIEIFGYTSPRAREYAVNLGMALQLTNIIRDVGVDARAGRIYLPRQDRQAFGVTEDDLIGARHTAAFVRLMAHEAERARHFYRLAAAAYPRVDARSLVAAEIMGRIYRTLLQEIEARDFRVFGERITVPAGRKVAIALRCWTVARLPRATDAVSRTGQVA
jgi:15-cis-phytoene synthase